MLRVYCDICGYEITEEAEAEGIDWSQLKLTRSIDGRTEDEIEHICNSCKPMVKEFITYLEKADRLARDTLLNLLESHRRLKKA